MSIMIALSRAAAIPRPSAIARAAARGRDDRRDEILHVADGEPLQLGRRQRQGIGNGTGVGDEQAQRFRVVRHEGHWRIVEPTKQRCHGLARHSAADEARGRRPHDVEPGQTSRRKESVAVAQRQLPVALLRQAAPSDIDAEQKIVLSMPSSASGSCRVAQAGERSRHEG